MRGIQILFFPYVAYKVITREDTWYKYNLNILISHTWKYAPYCALVHPIVINIYFSRSATYNEPCLLQLWPQKSNIPLYLFYKSFYTWITLITIYVHQLSVKNIETQYKQNTDIYIYIYIYNVTCVYSLNVCSRFNMMLQKIWW